MKTMLNKVSFKMWAVIAFAICLFVIPSALRAADDVGPQVSLNR